MTKNKIKVLSEKVANLIAAGEVVERPASVVKELLENALDAGSTEIEVEIRNAGFKYIRVTDNGIGMSPEDAQIAFLRHATSKVSKAEDLESIATMGFRGEALPSIASVSKLELRTAVAKQPVGYRLKINGGVVKAKGEAGCARGTTLVVEDLFFNTPARKKFMKSATTEQSHVVQYVETAALAHLSVRFKLVVDHRMVFQCPETESLPERLQAVYGRSLPRELIPVEKEAGGVWVRGLIANPKEHRHARSGMRFFINQRPVDHRGMAHAVIQAYRPFIPEGRFPVVYLFVTMPSQLVDVNVHPAKREVRLRDEAAMHHLVHAAVQESLKQADVTGGRSGAPEMDPGESNRFGNAFAQYRERALPMGWSASQVKESVGRYYHRKTGDSGTNYVVNEEWPAIQNEESRPGTVRELRIIGQVGKTYIAAQDQDGFFLVDQHALHERLLYEEYKAWPDNVPRQPLLLPQPFDLAPSQTVLLEKHLSLFNDLGVEISPLGGNTFSIQTKPSALKQGELLDILHEVLEWLMEEGKQVDLSVFREKTLHSMACKAAVKAGDRMQPEGMQELIEKMYALTGLPTCPHGRPYLYRLTWTELDKLFKRDYSS